MEPRLNEMNATVGSQNPKIFTTMLLGGIIFGSSSFGSTVFRETADYFLEHSAGSARSIGESNTFYHDDMAIQTGRTDTMIHQVSRFSTTSIRAQASLSVGASRSLDIVRNLHDGWQGPQSLGPTADTILDAYAFIEKLSSKLPEGPAPMIGLDSDGFVVMSWDSGTLTGSLSIFGDGTYAFYVANGRKVGNSGEARISDPIPTLLLEVLAA